MAERTRNTNFVVRNRLWFVLAGIAAAIVLLAASASQRKGIITVRAERATRGDIASTISTNGKIEPVENFEAHAPGGTTVKRVLVREGDQVRKGQLLVQLEDADARAQAAKALAQLRAAEADLTSARSGGTREEVLTTESQAVKAKTERDAAQRSLEALRRLQQKGAASPGEVQEAENRLRRADAELQLLQQKQTSRYSRPELEKVEAQADEARTAYEAAQEVLRSSNITAPREGTVYSLPVRAGQFVNAGDLLVQVSDLSKIQVRAFVDEPDIGRLAPGQVVVIGWDAVPDRKWEGKVTHVPTTVTLRGTRNVGEITCVVENGDRKLLPNVNVSVNVITAEHQNALTVPREAIHKDDGHHYVYEISDGELRRRYVETSISNLTRMEISNGLRDGAMVVISSTSTQPLREGQSVRVAQP